jgi:arylsulfatase A-like enzyme
MAQGLKEILGFRPLSSTNDFTQFFPGLLRLRQNAVVLRKHHTAASACVPSRTCIMTGRFPNVTGVDQTDGNFKAAEDVPWLDPNGAPTIGDWFRAAGYTTHYFGKWHVSEVEGPEYLEPWGFAEWEKSYPEPHGGTADNAGAFRDVGFTDKLVEFLTTKGKAASDVPWLAVGSLVNPHDCGLWPINWQTPTETGVVPWTNYPPPPSIPTKGQKSRLGGPQNNQIYVDLNPDGFPQQSGTLPRTYSESLDTKPWCQKEYALKWGLSMESSQNYVLAKSDPARQSPHPFQLQGQYAAAWSLSYNEFYAYVNYLMDLQLRRMLQALDDSGLAENTIVVFLSDHGDLQGAHGGMIQKWHNAYEETVRVPMVISSPLVNTNKQQMREILQPTSSIDFAPTVLALAGCDQAKILGQAAANAFAGADLSALVKGEKEGVVVGPDGNPRTGVLFTTNDMITELGAVNPGDTKKACYQAFLDNVAARIAAGVPLVPGPVRQPNNVRAFCTGDWKIARYVDPKAVEKDQWELYCLTADPVEQTNLVDFRTGDVRSDVTVAGMTLDDLKLKTTQLKAELARQESTLLSKP